LFCGVQTQVCGSRREAYSPSKPARGLIFSTVCTDEESRCAAFALTTGYAVIAVITLCSGKVRAADGELQVCFKSYGIFKPPAAIITAKAEKTGQ
jgi:hypothetical protein